MTAASNLLQPISRSIRLHQISPSQDPLALGHGQGVSSTTDTGLVAILPSNRNKDTAFAFLTCICRSTPFVRNEVRLRKLALTPVPPQLYNIILEEAFSGGRPGALDRKYSKCYTHWPTAFTTSL